MGKKRQKVFAGLACGSLLAYHWLANAGRTGNESLARPFKGSLKARAVSLMQPAWDQDNLGRRGLSPGDS